MGTSGNIRLNASPLAVSGSFGWASSLLAEASESGGFTSSESSQHYTYLRTQQTVNTLCQFADAFAFSNHRINRKRFARECFGDRFAIHGE